MHYHDRVPATPSKSERGERLTISYPARQALRSGGRSVVYIRRGEQPITDAEVEIMQLSLGAATSGPGLPTAQNDD